MPTALADETRAAGDAHQTGDALEAFRPDEADDFWCLLHLRIGSDDGSPASSDFTLQVGTPKAVQRHLRHDRAWWGRHHLIVERFDAGVIRAAVEGLIGECRGATVEAFNAALSRHFAWEYEDWQGV